MCSFGKHPAKLESCPLKVILRFSKYPNVSGNKQYTNSNFPSAFHLIICEFHNLFSTLYSFKCSFQSAVFVCVRALQQLL